MGESMALGLGGLTVRAPAHVCVLVRGRQELARAEQGFLRQGLRDGDVCLAVLEDPQGEPALAALAADPAAEGRLLLSSSWAEFLDRGQFCPQDMVEHLSDWVAAALATAGCAFARILGELTTTLREVIGQDKLLQYESELNRTVGLHPQIVLCVYELDGFSGASLVEILSTHPWVLIGEALISNPYYVPPEELILSRR
jgi:hypothetical protein